MHNSFFLKDKHLHYRYPELLSGNRKVYCDPLTAAAVTLTVASTGVSMYGQYQAGKTQQKYYNYLAEQNERAAEAAQRTAEQKTTIAQNEAAQRTKELKGDVARTIGAQKAAMAAMGLTGVSAEDILTDTANRAKIDEFNIRYGADIQSWAAKKGAAEEDIALRSQASLFRFAGKQARKAAAINMTSTLLGNASSLLWNLKLKDPGYKYTGQKISYGDKTYRVTTPTDYSNVLQWNPNKLY
jgi:hypothetical protein